MFGAIYNWIWNNSKAEKVTINPKELQDVKRNLRKQKKDYEFEQETVGIITLDDVLNAKSKLRKTESNLARAPYYTRPLLTEITNFHASNLRSISQPNLTSVNH